MRDRSLNHVIRVYGWRASRSFVDYSDLNQVRGRAGLQPITPR